MAHGKLVLGNNIDLMSSLECGKVQLVYIDPPFFSNASYKSKSSKTGKIERHAYTDEWPGGMKEYLTMLAVRLHFIKHLLSDTGSVWVHLDWHAAHYVKVIMDEIFGEENFVNEIIWNYKSGGSTKRHFARKHDTLLFYSKTDKYYLNIPKEKSYNRKLKPYKFKGVEEFEDELGWYTLVNMKDVWQIDMVGRTSGERTGYATQKPEALLSRIIESCSREGDTVCDFFGGSGTLAAACSKLGRSWISCDIGASAISAEEKRLAGIGACFELVKIGEESDSSACNGFRPKAKRAGSFVTLTGCEPGDVSDLRLDAKSRKHYERLAAENPLALIDYWCVDEDYDGNVFRPSAYILSKDGEVEKNAELKKPGRRVAVRAVDIFGRTGMYILEAEK